LAVNGLPRVRVAGQQVCGSDGGFGLSVHQQPDRRRAKRTDSGSLWYPIRLFEATEAENLKAIGRPAQGNSQIP
jgi:hypothetical protein